MRKFLLLITPFIYLGSEAQMFRGNSPMFVGSTDHVTTKQYTFGKMIQGNDTLIGYFKFESAITMNGQTVHYKKDLMSSGKRKFQSRDYQRFESDSIYMQTFGAISTVTGDILVMIPRVVDGPLQLFKCEYRGLYGKRKESVFVRTGYESTPIVKKNFKTQMRYLISEDKSLLDRIESEELKYEDIEEIINIFNKTNLQIKNELR